MDEDNYGGQEAQQQQQPPTIDLSPIESRLNRLAETLGGMQRNEESREIRSRIGAQEYQISQKLASAAGAVTRAEEALARAHDDGDGQAIARANRALVESVAARENAKAEKAEFDQIKQDITRRQGGASGAPGNAGQQTAQDAKDTTNLNSWKDSNKLWYGVDADLTKAAHEIDKQIRAAGVIPVGSQKYFEAIDRQMAQRYPEKFRSAPDTGSGGGGRQPAPSRGGRIPQTVLDGWARMGIDVNDDKALARMVKNREVLANKGILPTEPQYGQVMTR